MEEHWYACRIFHNRIREIKESIRKDGVRFFIPVHTVEKESHGKIETVELPIIPSLIFIRSNREYIDRLRKNPNNAVGAYCYPGTSEPAEISDREMEIFTFVTSVGGGRKLEAVDISLAKGDRVRVTGGIFAGAEGYIARVKNARRLIVAIEGVAAVATAYIPKEFILKL